MKNRGGFYTRSAQCRAAMEEGRESLSFRCSEIDAKLTGVEWHHGGSGVIAFFPKDENERQKIEGLRNELKSRTIKTKKAAIEYLKSTSGDYVIPYKVGKYGKFFNFWGEPDGELSISTEDSNFEAIRKLLNV